MNLLLLVFVLSTGILKNVQVQAGGSSKDTPEQPSALYYDYKTLQTVGLVLACLIAFIGVLILLSKSKRFNNCTRKRYSGKSEPLDRPVPTDEVDV
uniref:sodium/potassium-transporting ATPase subunit gamma-like n=1 Tax=Myxine glutinosa TaxID=7769 RepID=UPI00358E1F33